MLAELVRVKIEEELLLETAPLLLQQLSSYSEKIYSLWQGLKVDLSV